MPQRTEQLVWLGLSPHSLAVLQDHITFLPEVTPVNLNTASAEVLSASLPGLDMASARQAIALRQRQPWGSLEAAKKALGPAGNQINEKQHSVKSRYFEVQGRMRIDNVVQQELSLMRRDGNQVRILWRVKRPPQLLSTPLK